MPVDKHRYVLIHRAGAVSIARDEPIAGCQQKTPFVVIEINRHIVGRDAGGGRGFRFQRHHAATRGGQRD
ncbi:hypothetical protein D3C80_1794940 [compost metagenome]